MANALGIDLGKVYSDVENLKTAKLRRESMERDAADEKEARGLREKAVGGDRGAMMRLAAIDPAGARSLQSTLNALTPKQRAAARKGVEGLGDTAAWVLNSENPEQAYATLLSSLPEDQRAQMPPTYNQQWVELQLVRALGADDYLDHLDRQRKANEPAAAEPLGSAESNAIWRQAAALYGGLYDPNTGAVTGLQGSETKVNEVAAEAERIMQDEGKSAAQAVQEANRRLYGNGAQPSTPSQPELPEGFTLD